MVRDQYSELIMQLKLQTNRNEFWLDLMQDHRFVGKLNERLRHAEGQGPQSGSKPTYENESLHGDQILSSSVNYSPLSNFRVSIVSNIQLL